MLIKGLQISIEEVSERIKWDSVNAFIHRELPDLLRSVVDGAHLRNRLWGVSNLFSFYVHHAR